MRDIKNKLTSSKNTKNIQTRKGKSFGYQVLGFGAGGSALGYAPTQIGIFAFGVRAASPPKATISNLVNSSGVVATDVTFSGTGRGMGFNAAAVYGFDKGIFAFGEDASGFTAITNLVSNAGVVATDTAAVSGVSARYTTCGGYGGDKAIAFGGYNPTGYLGISNLINDAGVVAADTAKPSGVTGRTGSMIVPFGNENSNSLIVYGNTPAAQNMSNIVSTEGVVGTDVTGVGTARGSGAGCRYNVGLGVAAYGTGVAPAPYYSISNKVNISGVVATDTSGVGTARTGCGACGYGGDKGIFGYGAPGGYVSVTNLVNTSGVIGTDVTGVGTARTSIAAAGIGQ